MTNEEALKLRAGDLCVFTYSGPGPITSPGSILRFVSHESDNSHVWELMEGECDLLSSCGLAEVQPVALTVPNRCLFVSSCNVELMIMPNEGDKN